MRVPGRRGELAGSNGRQSSEPRDAAGPASESVDEEISSLLASLDQTTVDRGPASDETTIQTSRRPRELRSAQGSRFASVDRFDLILLVLAVGLGFAVGLTVFFVNG
jgi:hypothetical protein